MTIRAIVIGLLLPLLTEATTSVQQPKQSQSIDPASLAKLLDSLVPAAMNAEHIPGAVVSVVSGRRIIFQRG